MSMHSRLLLLTCALSAMAAAQQFEVFGGYTLGKMKPEVESNRATMNGWNGSFTTYFTSRFGLATDVAGFYGSATPTTTLDGVSTALPPVSIRQYSFMAGPQIRLFRTSRFETSFRALFGGAYGHVPDSASYAGLDQTTPAMQFGSNFDVKVSRRVSLRFSPGLYLTQFGDNQTQKNFRFSIGPVFHFGAGD